MSTWLVVPTLGDRERYLTALLAGARMSVVVIRTDEAGDTFGEDLSGGRRMIVIHDVDPPNIHRWWNRGIDVAVNEGADVVIVCNDDVHAEPGALAELAAHVSIDDHGPMLVWPYDHEHASVRVTDISGWCYALDPTAIRPDEAFTWWWGDNDLQIRARGMRPGDGVLAVMGLPIRHLRAGWRYGRDVSALIEADRRVFAERYPALMRSETP